MARRGLTYSRVISWLKVLLPVVALGLLSTMFLFSETVSPTSVIPFAKVELQERARDQRITEPYFSGQTNTGYAIAITAKYAKPDPENTRITLADTLDANITISDDNIVQLNSKRATVNSLDLDAVLSGSVKIQSTNGYNLTTDELSLNMNDGSAKSDTLVTGSGPAGSFTAGAMELSVPPNNQGARFLFTNGVKLIYKPQ